MENQQKWEPNLEWAASSDENFKLVVHYLSKKVAKKLMAAIKTKLPPQKWKGKLSEPPKAKKLPKAKKAKKVKFVKPVKVIKESFKLKKPITQGDKYAKYDPFNTRSQEIVPIGFKLQSPNELTRWQARNAYNYHGKKAFKAACPVFTRRVPILLTEKTWRRLEKEAAKASNQAGRRPKISEVAAALLIYALDERGVTLPEPERKKKKK